MSRGSFVAHKRLTLYVEVLMFVQSGRSLLNGSVVDGTRDRKHVPKFEPVIRLNVQGVVLVTQFPRRDTLLECLRLRSCPVLVRPTNVQCFPISSA